MELGVYLYIGRLILTLRNGMHGFCSSSSVGRETCLNAMPKELL